MQWKLNTECAKRQPCLTRWRVAQHGRLQVSVGELNTYGVLSCSIRSASVPWQAASWRGHVCWWEVPWQDRKPKSLRSGRAYCFITTLLQKLTGLPMRSLSVLSQVKGIINDLIYSPEAPPLKGPHSPTSHWGPGFQYTQTTHEP